MKLSEWRPVAFPVAVTGMLVAVLGALWVLRHRLAAETGDPIQALVGWIAVVFLTTTVATIVWACTAQQKKGMVTSRRFLGYALLTDGCGLLLLAVGTTSGMLHLADVARVYVVLMTWLGLWISVTMLLRARSPALAAAVSALASMAIFAGPVGAVPLVRGATQLWGADAGKQVEAVVIGATPMLAVLDGVRPSFRVEWAQLPQMYHLTAIRQDMTPALPRWWMTTLGYAGAGGICWLLRRPWRERPG